MSEPTDGLEAEDVGGEPTPGRLRADEEEAPGESAPDAGPDAGPDPAREEPAPRRPGPERIVAALLAVIAVVLAAVWISRCDQAAPTEDVGESAGSSDEAQGPKRLVQGKVLREVPLDPDADAGLGSSSKPSEASLADEEISAFLEDLPPWKLEPPGPGGCELRAWQRGQLVARAASCAAGGAYEVALGAEITGVIQLEMSIPGQLRGLIDVELAPSPGALTVAPTVALGPGHSVLGQTVNARGEPVEDVIVQALPRPTLEEALPWRTVSDAQGRFEFTTLPYGPVSLRAIKQGYALSVVEAVAPEDGVLMVLDELIDLEGSVVADAALLERAIVRLEGSSVWPALERSIGADGAFVFERLPDGIYGVEVTVPAATPGGPEYASVPLENVTPDLRVGLALVPAFRVPVRVVDPEGEPVPGARVTLGYREVSMLQKTAEADGAGRVKIGPVVPGPYMLRADADGFLPPEGVEVEVGMEGFEGDEQVVVLIRPAKLEGIVVDEDDRPVAGAEVRLDSEVAFAVGEGDTRRRLFAAAIGASDGSLGVTAGAVPDIPLFVDDDVGSIDATITDAQGRFEIDLLLPGTHRIWATHGEHAASAVESLELRSGEIHGGLRLRLREGVPLTGVVRSANGEPIAGVQVDLGDGLILTTDERGVFDAGFRRGDQRLILRGRGLIPEVVEVELGDGALDLELELEPAEQQFEGRVVDGNNQPIADVEVELRPLDGLSASVLTWTDERGIYVIDELGPGPVEVEYRHRDYLPATGRGVVDELLGLDHEIVLESGWSAAILVRSAVRGQPIEAASLVAGTSSAITDKQGMATLSLLVGEVVEVVVQAPGWVEQIVELRDDGTGLIEVTIELVEGGSLSGTIDDDLGEPVAGASIEVRSMTGELLGATRSDGRGRWRVDDVPAGDVEIRAEPPPARAAVLAPTRLRSDVIRGELTKAVRLRFEQL